MLHLCIQAIAVYNFARILYNLLNNTIISFVIKIIIGFSMNKIYLNFAQKKVDKIKANNLEKSSAEIKSKCIMAGGTSVGSVVIGILVEVVLEVVFLILAAFLGLSTGIASMFYNAATDSSTGKFNGTIYGDPTVTILDEFNITIPDKFSANSLNQPYFLSYEYTGSSTEVFNKCTFTFEVADGYTSAEDFVKQMQDYHSDENASIVLGLTENNVEWYTFNYNDGIGENHIYGTTKDNKVYLFMYTAQEDADSDCLSYKNQIVSSIKPK